MTEKYTIKDIAKLAGVSKGTVDRVLHNRGKVSQKALDKINAVLDKIDYEPNLIARNLKNNKVYRIVAIIPDPSKDPYWLPCVSGLEQAIRELKAFSVSIKIFYFNPESKKSFLNVNNEVINNPPDAILLAPLFYKETLSVVETYDSLGVLVSTINNHVQSEFIKNFVSQDLFKSGRVVAKLFDLLYGKGQIAIVHIDESYKNATHMQEKESGFRNYFLGKKEANYEIVTLKLKNPNYEINFLNFIKENPDLTGIFVTTSKAYQIAKMVKDIQPSKKIGIIGYDLIDRNVDYLNEGVIDFLIHQNPKNQAYLGITCLAEYFLFNKEIPNATLLPIEIINTENANYYLS